MAFSQNHRGTHFFTQFFMGDAKTNHLANRWVIHQDFIDFTRADFFTSPVDDFFQATRDGDIAFGVDHTLIARAKPAMGEGFGDYWAGSLSARFRTINWSDGKDQSLCVAEWDATSCSGTNPPCLRRLDSGKKYPADVVGQVHADGQIWSAALWQIRGLLGPEKADRLILQHHFLIAKDASFNNAANALLTTITAFIGGANTYGYTSAERDKVVCILRTRGFTVGGSSTPCPW